MNEELLKSIKHVIDYLDDMMRLQPTRELADTSNYLENLKAELEARGGKIEPTA